MQGLDEPVPAAYGNKPHVARLDAVRQGQVLRQQRRRRTQARDSKRLAAQIGGRPHAGALSLRHQLGLAGGNREQHQRDHGLALGLQVDRVVVAADHALGCAREQGVGRTHPRMFAFEDDVQLFIAEIAQALRERCRKVDLLFCAADDQDDALGARADAGHCQQRCQDIGRKSRRGVHVFLLADPCRSRATVSRETVDPLSTRCVRSDAA